MILNLEWICTCGPSSPLALQHLRIASAGSATVQTLLLWSLESATEAPAPPEHLVAISTYSE